MICLRGALLNNFEKGPGLEPPKTPPLPPLYVPVNTYINTYAFNHLTVTRHTHISYKLAELKYIYTLLKATSKNMFWTVCRSRSRKNTLSEQYITTSTLWKPLLVFMDFHKYTWRNPVLADSRYNKLYMENFSSNGTIKSITSRIPRTLLTKSETQEWKQMRQMVLYNVTSLFICILAKEAAKTVKNSCDSTLRNIAFRNSGQTLRLCLNTTR